jgi:hypothetical protein
MWLLFSIKSRVSAGAPGMGSISPQLQRADHIVLGYIRANHAQLEMEFFFLTNAPYYLECEIDIWLRTCKSRPIL